MDILKCIVLIDSLKQLAGSWRKILDSKPRKILSVSPFKNKEDKFILQII